MPKVIFILIFLFSSIAHADRTMLSNVSQSAALLVTASWFTTGSNNPAENTVIPCAGSQCSYGVVLYYQNGSIIDFNGRSIPVTAGMTWKMANDAFVRRFGATGIAAWQWNWQPSQWDVCIGAIPVRSGGFGGIGRPFSIYSSPCTPVPPVNVQCNVNGDANITHGTLNAGQVNGHTAEATIQLSCNRAATVSIEVPSPDIDLGGGVKSRVSVTNGSRISVANSVALKIKSVLSGTAPTAGQHSGSTVIVFNIV
ncbi:MULTISPECIES: hypothetical protein [Providencia]|uniref:hypothetical protein n=1 Tax=Providencia TaxID=586 RepID=UPI0014196931|nr:MULTISPECIES: hypothetical protein [Providencia]EJD6080336.1 hypothetical protein [Providencia rettgeri]EJD6400019.1 hypothetical protein [Providencia rettgeri]EJD6583496.1 hypothetical protein [Providencia rettgeri]EJD6602429.1 hypothetical protein [Providencia rettgeri]EJD6613123.1 hypothetical protein [Providencia rettgeri]